MATSVPVNDRDWQRPLASSSPLDTAVVQPAGNARSVFHLDAEAIVGTGGWNASRAATDRESLATRARLNRPFRPFPRRVDHADLRSPSGEGGPPSRHRAQSTAGRAIAAQQRTHRCVVHSRCRSPLARGGGTGWTVRAASPRDIEVELPGAGQDGTAVGFEHGAAMATDRHDRHGVVSSAGGPSVEPGDAGRTE